MIRIVFCLFADDTGIFEQRDQFYEFIDTKTKEDGSDTGEFLSKLFEVLNTPLDARYNTLDKDINEFCNSFPRIIDDLETLLTDNRIFKQRNVDIGVVSKQDALDYSFSGVMIRGLWNRLGFKKISTI
mgnify:CR=1 FL=1